ncbi:hypothetical protein CL653_01680 [bacterium]|nr:hypothetical protein [bacterium]
MKKTIAVLGFIILVGFGYKLFIMKDDSEIMNNPDIVGNAARLETEEFLRRLNDLKQIELKTEVLSDNRFTGLVDYSRTIKPSLVGRDNPFGSI